MRRPRKIRIEDWDNIRDREFISAAEKASAIAIVEGIAIESAMMSHPITRFVQRCPFEDCSRYPAISGSYVSLYRTITGKKLRKQTGRKADRNSESVPNLTWTLPGQDDSRKSSRCGVFRDGKNKIPLKMCMANPKDYMKAIGNHCGSLKCKNCMNSAAMNAGIRIEDRIMTPIDIAERNGSKNLVPKHWTISPPQKWMKGIAQRSDHFSALVDDLVALLPLYGIISGAILFHPWRLNQEGTRWEFSPHFHLVGYGHLQNESLRKEFISINEKLGGIWTDEDGEVESWVIKNIHPNEPMRSIRHTLGYILTHVGIGTFIHDVNWDLAAEDVLIPAVTKGLDVFAKEISTIEYNADWKECGLYAEHLDEFDFLEWTKDTMTGDIATYRPVGLVSKVRTFTTHTEKVVRTCPECGEQIGLFHSIEDHDPEPVYYRRRSKIRCMAEDIRTVREYWEEHKERFLDSGYSVLDFAMSIPQCSTPETKGVQTLEYSESREDRVTRRDRCLVYLPSIHGQGLDPKIVTKAERNELRKAGLCL